MFGAFGAALHVSCLNFVSQAALDLGVPARLGLQRPLAAVRNTRRIGKADMSSTTPPRTSRLTRRPTRSAPTACC
jgi:urease alpha subunit